MSSEHVAGTWQATNSSDKVWSIKKEPHRYILFLWDSFTHPNLKWLNLTNFWYFCSWFLLRKAIWYVSNCRILCDIYLLSSSCLCPVGCLSFVRWKKNQNKYYVIFRKFNTYQIAFFLWHAIDIIFQLVNWDKKSVLDH